jgi:ATPase involved in DNA repair
MINHISISNFAIIDNTEIDFEDGLNVITGETGAGKSIVIEAVSLALGSRADSAFVRYGADKAVVQLAGELDGEEIVITREVSSSGKNLCRLNGQLVTLTELGETCRRLADIHGQYDNQSLLNPDNHLSLVDRYSRDKIAPVRKAFDEAYEQYHVVRSKLNSLLSKEAENARKHAISPGRIASLRPVPVSTVGSAFSYASFTPVDTVPITVTPYSLVHEAGYMPSPASDESGT